MRFRMGTKEVSNESVILTSVKKIRSNMTMSKLLIS